MKPSVYLLIATVMLVIGFLMMPVAQVDFGEHVAQTPSLFYFLNQDTEECVGYPEQEAETCEVTLPYIGTFIWR